MFRLIGTILCGTALAVGVVVLGGCKLTVDTLAAVGREQKRLREAKDAGN